jgi:hypothetical protein
MSVLIGSATDYADLLNQLDSFLTAAGQALTPSFVGTGNGTIDAHGGTASVAEVITVTFNSATAFNVVGSVSGSLGSGTVGTLFTNSKAVLTITAGGTAFVATDAFTFAVCPPWTSLRRVSGSEMIWQAPGNGGLDEIIVGAKAFSNVGADYYNWRLGGFTAFNSGQPFNQQVGYNGGNAQAHSSPVLNLWNSTIPFWFVANGRRVIIVAKISTVYCCAYLGFINSYMAPGAFPYPLAVGGSMCWSFSSEPAAANSNWRWSYTGAEMRNFAIPHDNALSNPTDSQLALRLASGTWQGFCSSNGDGTYGQVWPYAYVDRTQWDWRPDLDGGYSLLPIVLVDNSPNVYGELDGVYAVTGFSQGAENTVTINGIAHLVVQNVFANTKSQFFVVRLS